MCDIKLFFHGYHLFTNIHPLHDRMFLIIIRDNILINIPPTKPVRMICSDAKYNGSARGSVSNVSA